MELQHPIGWDITPTSWQETWLYTTYTPPKRPPIHQLYTTCIHLLSGTWPSSFLKASWSLTARLVLGNLFFSFPSEMGCALAPALGFLLPEPIRNWKLPGSAGGLSWLLDLLVEPWWAMVSLAHSCSLPRSFHILSLKRFLHGGHLGSQEQARSASSKIISLHPSSIPSTNSKDPYEVTPALQPSSDFEKKASQHNTTLPRSRNVCSTLVRPHLPFNHWSIYWQDKHGKMEGRMLNFRWFRSTSSCDQLQSVQTSSSRTTKVCQSHQCLLLFYFRCSRQWRNTAWSILHPRIAIHRYMYCVYLHICTCYIYIFYLFIYLYIYFIYVFI